MPRRAERLIEEALGEGLISNLGFKLPRNHVAYHWKLAVLSGRSFDLLGPDEELSLKRAAELARPDQDDGWAPPLQVVDKLINLLRQEQPGDPEPVESRLALRKYQALVPERREEIRRHLDMILVGGITDQLDAIAAKDIPAQRTGGNRADRVWKFFEPIPEPPKPASFNEQALTGRERTAAAIGALLAGAGLVMSLAVTALEHPLDLAAIEAFLLAAGGFACWYSAVPRLAAYGRLADKDGEYLGVPAATRYSVATFPPLGAGPPAPSAHESAEVTHDRARRTEFARLLKSFLNYQFRRAAPPEREGMAKWNADTAGIKATLEMEFLAWYEDSTEPGGINWLVSWRVAEIARRWQEGTLYDYREELRAPVMTTLQFAFGIVSLGAGIIMSLAEVFLAGAILGLVVAFLLLVGGAVLWQSQLDMYLVIRYRLPADQADLKQRANDEKEQYELWAEKLKDRPTDGQMARWLDYDMMHVKTMAMNHHGLANRDLIAHVALAESGYLRERARMVNGPWRFSVYTISLFLLTDAGVRAVTVDLDFATGKVSNERRTDFRYDAIALARVAQVGHRFEGFRRHVILLNENDQRRAEEVRSFTLSPGFWLSFVGGQPIGVVTDRFDDGFLYRLREDPAQLVKLGFDTSGVTAALSVLEPAAAEGREWITEARARRGRR
jgi:hypothetical protein